MLLTLTQKQNLVKKRKNRRANFHYRIQLNPILSCLLDLVLFHQDDGHNVNDTNTENVTPNKLSTGRKHLL